MSWLKVIRLSVPAVAVVLLAGMSAPALARHAPPAGGKTPAALRAQAESKAFAASSRLTTAQLIQAARDAGSRLAVHTSPPPAKGIAVHPPIVVTRSRPVTYSWRSDGGLEAVGAVPLGVAAADAAVLPATVTPLTGSVTSPQNQGQTSTIFSLQARLTGGCGSPCSATAYKNVTFQYRLGTAGTFANIPASAVSNGGAAVTWPVAASVLSDGSGVQSPNLTWLAKQTITASGLLQIQAVFTDGLGDSYTTSPVTVTLDRSGTDADFAVSQVGPAIVGLQSGNLSVAATDVSISSYGADLVATRSFNTMAPGTASMFGPGWTSSLPVLGTTMTWSSVTDGGSYAVLTSTTGSVDTFATGATVNGVTSYTAQGTAAADGLVLTKSSAGFSLTDPSGDQVQFFAANSSKPNYYTPSRITQPGSARSVGVIFDAVSTDASYGKPVLMVAPNPNLAAGTSTTTACPYPASASTWAAGCRGLQFAYTSGGAASQASFVSYDGSALTSTPVAAYSYDATGRLSGQWDPRISTHLVTSYSYDENTSSPTYGWLTSVSPAQSATGGLKPWAFGYNTTASSPDYGKLTSVTRTHGDGTTATQTIAYRVPLTTAAGGPVTMDAATVGTWNQTDVPASASAVFPATHVPASPPAASDWQYAQISYYDANGRQVNTADYGSGGWNIDTTQYDAYGDQISDLTAADRAAALAAGSSSASVAAELQTVSQYTTAADGSKQVSDSYGPLHNASVPGQGTQQVRTHTHYVYDQGAPSTGGPYDLATTQTQTASLGAGIPGTSDTDARTTQFLYSNASTGIGWTLRTPLQAVADPGGLGTTYTAAYNTDSTLYGGQPLAVKTCLPSDTGCSGAGTRQTIYYTAGTNAVDSACGSKPAWADLVCKTKPAAQPGTPGLPSLPVTTYTYNVYLQPLTKTETLGSATRTTTYTYDAAGRQTRMSIATSGSGMGAPVQDQVTVYSPATGLVTDLESVDSGGTVTGDIKSGYDDFGQLSSYTDASSNQTTYGYDLAGRITSRDDGNGTVSYTYDTRGLVTSEHDSTNGTFTAAYNPDGALASETYPDYPADITGSYGYDESGTPTRLSYAGNWGSPLDDSATPDSHGNWTSQRISQSSQTPPLDSSQVYTYDNAGRLTKVQDTLNGQCTTRSYGYNADSDRTMLTTYAPASGGACQTTTGTSETYSYDSADRLLSSTAGGTTSPYGYDTQGDITTTPSADAGGNGTLTATYYANGMLASQAQNGQTISWQLDPTEKRYASYTESRPYVNNVTYNSHYSDTGNSPSWISGSDSSSDREVRGPNGMLAASVDTSVGIFGTYTQNYQDLPDLHGDILAEATMSDTSSPFATGIYDEFGHAEGTYATGPCGWLGGYQISNDALGGSLLMGARAYNVNTGRFDQPDPVYGGSANAYDYALQNPVANTDLNGTSFQGYALVWLWYSYYYSRWFFTWYVNLWDYRYAQLAEYFISFTGGWYWHYKSGVSWFWKPKNHWYGGALLPSWEQTRWLGAWVQFYWQGYRLLWGWLPTFDYGWSIPVWISGWR